MYTLANAKDDYKEGWIDGFSIIRRGIPELDVKNLGWVIEVWKESPEGIKRQICTARGDVRIFKTLDAAVGIVEEIGWSVDYLTR